MQTERTPFDDVLAKVRRIVGEQEDLAAETRALRSQIQFITQTISLLFRSFDNGTPRL